METNVCYNHSCPNNRYDWEEENYSECCYDFCEYGCQFRTPKDKKKFEQPTMEVIDVDDDIIVTSGGHNGWNKNPHNPHYQGDSEDD